MADTRLDIYVKESMNISRQKAQELVKEGFVRVNNKICKKAAFIVTENDNVEVESTEKVLKYAGRGGYKLEKSIDVFGLSIKGICIDIGASTGGFTDCMIQKGAKRVYAVDVGSNQLADKLKNNNKVISMENTDIRNAEIEKADFISCDVSFISLKKIIFKISELLKEDGICVLLIKPQFEAGRENIGKNGIVKNPKVHKKVIKDIADYASENGIYIEKITFSPIRGGDGNIEYLACGVKSRKNIISRESIESVVNSAFNEI